MTTAGATSSDPKAFQTFAEFYPFYLSEHSNRTCRRLHFVGSTLSLACLGAVPQLLAEPHNHWMIVQLIETRLPSRLTITSVATSACSSHYLAIKGQLRK